MKRSLLIDGDMVLYRICCAATNQDFGFKFDREPGDTAPPPIDITTAKRLLDVKLREFKRLLDGERVHIAFSDERQNWRKSVCPSYKANRKGLEKPRGFFELREYAMEVYRSLLVTGLEADDILGIWATTARAGESLRMDKILVSADKDFLSVPCKLYNPGYPDRGVVTVTLEDADRFHLRQTLMGDSVDGYPGIPGVGPVKADKILDEECSWRRVIQAYEEAGLSKQTALMTARIARILRRGEYTKSRGVYLWKPTKRFTLYGEAY